MPNVDKFGVAASYATGQIKYDYNENFRPDGNRYDFTGLGANGYVNCELIGYFADSNPPGDECSGKMGGGKHSGSNAVKCYSIGIHCQTGNCRYRCENPHPNYYGGQSGGKGKAMSSSFTGYKFVKINLSNGVRIEIFQDIGNNESTPANQWQKCASWVDTEENWQQPGSDHQETIRVDEIGGSFKWKWISLREIVQGDQEGGTVAPDPSGGPPKPVNQYQPYNPGYFPPIGSSQGSGTGTPGPKPGTGGGTGGGTSGGGTGSGTGSGGTGTGTDSPPAEQAPPAAIYVTRKFPILWTIDTVNYDACSAGLPPAEQAPVEIFSAEGDNIFADTKSFRRVGIAVNSAKSVFIGKRIRKVSIFMKRFGLGTISGTIYLRIRSRNGTIMEEFPITYDASNMDNNGATYVFTHPMPVHTIERDDYILVEYPNGGTAANYVRIQISETDKADGPDSCLVTDDGATLKRNPAADCAMKIEI